VCGCVCVCVCFERVGGLNFLLPDIEWGGRCW
jgi:hypothetical protein